MAHSAPGPEGQPPQLNYKQAKALAKASRPWYKKKRFILPLILLAIILIGAIASSGGGDKGGDSGKSNNSSSNNSSNSSSAKAGLGKPVREGDIEFTLKSWKCGVAGLGNNPFNEKPQGQFCVASVVYKNMGQEAKTFDAGTAMTAYHGDTKYSPNSTASIEANSNDQTFLQQVNPGNTVSGNVVFDIPKNIKIDTINIVDGFTGDGTPIKVS